MTKIGIQSGLKTHHHDQSILSVNFNTMNTIVRSPKKPIPPPLDEFESDIFDSFTPHSPLQAHVALLLD